MDERKLELQELKREYSLNHFPIIEHLWGHRFRTDQTPMLLLFELLCVIENQYQAKKRGLIDAIFSKNNDTLYFNHKRSFKLRVLLYQNEILETLYNSSLTEEEKWNRQFEFLQNIDNENFVFRAEDIGHIKKNFQSFDNFYNVIKILNSLTFDPMSNKRWTSRFIYPINNEYIWSDYDNIRGSEDRRFFSRGGELLYLMLCRSSYRVRNQLEEYFTEWLEKEGDSYSKLARSLAIKEERIPLEVSKRKKLGYLQYDQLSCFETLAEDTVRVMSLPLERLDKVKVLADIFGFHVGNYILTVGEIFSSDKNSVAMASPCYVAEVLSRNTNSIRKSSIQSISMQRNKLKRALYKQFEINFKAFVSDIDSEEERRRLLNAETENAVKYLTNHISNYPNICFREIGFVSKKNTRSYRYVVAEDFLHSLVISLLGPEKRMEITKFIDLLALRYNIFITQAPDESYEILQSDLNRNYKNLSSLLYQMGMLRHLSDACSYVVNPYLEETV